MSVSKTLEADRTPYPAFSVEKSNKRISLQNPEQKETTLETRRGVGKKNEPLDRLMNDWIGKLTAAARYFYFHP